MFELCPEKAYEFFVLQRMMGDATHDTVTKFLPAASCLRVNSLGDASVTQYWDKPLRRPSERKTSDLTDEFVDLFAKSMQTRMQDDRTFGVFLSGGHDSRIVAAYANKPATCYTLGFTDNHEVECARKIADAIDQDHVFWPLRDDYFAKTFETSNEISGAMYALDHALFLPQEEGFEPHSDVYLHGHGLDYMYHGMYLHATPQSFLGRPTFIKKMVDFPDDLSAHFIDTVSFRLKYDMRSNMVLPSQRARYEKGLYHTIKTMENNYKDRGMDDNDVWENFIFHTFSRHYTFTNVISKRAWGEVRTPSFDNNLYNFFLTLPNERRLHADMLRGAMRKHSARIDRIPTGNYGIPAGWSPYAKTALLIGRKVMRDFTKMKRFYPPSSLDRTWPERDDYMRAHPDYWAQAIAPLQDNLFQEFLDFINWDALKNSPELLLNEPHGASFMMSLMTYYFFYKSVYS